MSPAISLMLLQTLHNVKLCTDVNAIILIIAFGFRILSKQYCLSSFRRIYFAQSGYTEIARTTNLQ